MTGPLDEFDALQKQYIVLRDSSEVDKLLTAFASMAAKVITPKIANAALTELPYADLAAKGGITAGAAAAGIYLGPVAAGAVAWVGNQIETRLAAAIEAELKKLAGGSK